MKINYIVLLSIILSSCLETTTSELADKPIKLGMSIDGFNIGQNKNNLPNGFGLFLISADEEYSYKNRKMIIDNSGGVGSEDPSAMLWKDNSTPINVTAYHPYNIENRELTDVSGSVILDQTTLINLKNSDYLYYKANNVMPNHDGIGVVFDHALSKLNIVITSASGGVIENVEIGGTNTMFNWSLLNGDVTFSANSLNLIKPFHSSSTGGVSNYEALIVPQNVELSKLTVSFTLNGKQYIWRSEKGEEFSQKMSYKLNIGISESFVISVGSMTVSDWEDGGIMGESDAKPVISDLNMECYGRALLTKDEQEAYDHILLNAMDWSDGVRYTSHTLKHINMAGYKISADRRNLVFSCLKNDNHWFFTQYPAHRNFVYENGNIKSFDFKYKNYPNYTDYLSDIKRIRAKRDEIIAKVPRGATVPQKIRIIHDEFLHTVSYGGMNFAYAADIRGAFLEGKVICDGYARALAYLYQSAGIDVVYIVGNVGEEGDRALHAWVKVKVDGKWYMIDPTWNDGKAGGGVYHHYFLLGDINSLKTHIPLTSNEGALYYPYIPVGDPNDYPIENTIISETKA